MSELPNLPPAPRRTRPLPPDGLAAAVAGGRRRRARFGAGAGAGAVTAVFALVALLSSPATENDSLRTASPAPEASAAAAESEPAPEPGATPAPAPGASAGPGGGGSGQASPEPGASAAAGSGESPGGVPPAEPPPPAQRPAYVEQTDEDARGTSICSAFRTGPGACSENEDNGPVVQRGTPVVLAQRSCSGPDSAGDNVDVFAGGQETELVVRRDGGQEVFRFSSTVRYVQGPHERRLRPGRCLEYRQVWDGVDTAGRPVPAGEYQLELTVMPDREYYEFDDGTRMFEEKGRVRTSSASVRLVD